VHLQLQNLCRVSNARKDRLVRKALLSLPKGLKDTYARIVQQIMNKSEYERSLATRCLRWVLYAQHPLEVRELRYALATFDESQNARDFELDDLDVILGACANLLVEQEDLSLRCHRTIVRPIHYSVQEYFASDDQSLHSPIVKLPIGNRMTANGKLAVDCLAHLYQPLMLSGQFESINHPGCRLSDDFFLCYAASYFDAHLLATDPKVARRHIEKILESDSDLFRSILNTRSFYSRLPRHWYSKTTIVRGFRVLYESAI
jgi:hypothetical protein